MGPSHSEEPGPDPWARLEPITKSSFPAQIPGRYLRKEVACCWEGKGGDGALLPPADSKIAPFGEEVAASHTERHPDLWWRHLSQPQGLCMCVCGDTCSASTGTNLPEGQRKDKNRSDYVKDLVPHVLLAVQQWSLTEERLHQGSCPC